jgi:putative transcriptional regulator
MSKRSYTSSILQAVHETAEDFHTVGMIDQRTMRDFDALCLAPVPAYDGQQIASIRKSHRLSQPVMASLLNTSVSALRQWESGAKKPSSASAKLIYLLEKKGIEGLL